MTKMVEAIRMKVAVQGSFQPSLLSCWSEL